MPLFPHLDPGAYHLPVELRDRLLSPSTIIWLDRVRRNVARVVEALDGDPSRWRPHVKTTKLPPVWRELVEAGVSHFKCATTREARHLLQTLEEVGVEGDILLSHPLVGPNLEALGKLASSFPQSKVSVLVEDPELAGQVPSHLGLFVDVNPGMDRTGIPASHSHQILEVARAAGSRLRGLHYYDGHHHQRGETRLQAVHGGYDQLVDLIGQLLVDGLAVPEVVTAGTPAFLSAIQHQPLRELEHGQHRVSPGTVVFHDARSQEQNPEFGLEPAALVFTRVISRPRDGRVTCDAGSKSIAAEAGDPCAVVLGKPQLVAATPSEEHLPLEVTGGDAPMLGEELLLIPRHVCPTVNLAEEVVLMDGDRFVGVEPVAARAHDVLAD